MTSLEETFNLNDIDPDLYGQVGDDIERDADDFHAEQALNRIFQLRCAFAEINGRKGMYDDLFFGVPIINQPVDPKDHEVTTPHRLAFMSGDGLHEALNILNKMRPNRD